MAKMLRHKETGELFIWTDPLSKLSELEPAVDDPVAAVIAEMAAQDEPVVEDPVVVEAPSFIEAPVVEAVMSTKTPVASPPVARATTQKRTRTA